ncbi:ATP-grasp domain-containing protein [Aeromonas bivalvium]|uniref:ATP-grasp domain-containing protein n=1 Tax=Aeromonas bivalvium TaxID=440079 RepID=UPI0038CF52E2
MNIVILHRLPYGKIRYDQVIDQGTHRVDYLCLPGGQADLPPGSHHHEVASFEAEELARQCAPLLRAADRLIARSEYELLAAALLRERFAIPGDRPAAILPLRDKWAMRLRCRAADIPQPDFWSLEAFARLPDGPGCFVLKPRLEASSTGIVMGDRQKLLGAIGQLTRPDDYFVEAFIPGSICHLDGFLRDGEVVQSITSRYVGNCLDYAGGAPLGSVQIAPQPQMETLLRQTLAALGQAQGCFHFELIQDEAGRVHFLETACRVGGAGVADTFALRTGLNLYHIDLQYQLHGEITQQAAPLTDTHYGWFVYPAHHRGETQRIHFDHGRWGALLHSWHQATPVAARPGSISYATGATPLSGIVQGRAETLPLALGALLEQTRVEYISTPPARMEASA